MAKKDKSATQPKITLPKDALLKVNLGQAFAEYDKVLIKPGVFVRTPAILGAQDFDRSKCFFVGRRGTGKTAITLFLGSTKRDKVISIHPQLFATLADKLDENELKDVRQQPFHSLVASFKRAIVDEVIAEWARRKLVNLNHLPDKLRAERNNIEVFDFDTRTLVLVEQIFDSLKKKDDKAWTKQMAKAKEIIHLADEMQEGPAWEFSVLIDRIDDTWNGSDMAVVLLMALMHACLELAASSATVHPLLFLRENLFQRVRQIDSEFTRLETAVVSLDWTKELLAEMIARRLHLININPKPPLEQTWDLFFEPIDGDSSFNFVAEYCQHRPRDVLIYCSLAVEEAQAHRHPKVTVDDLTKARLQFSRNRLKDVGDEYSENFPQIQLVLGRFHGLGQEFTVPALTEFIQKLLVDVEVLKYCGQWLKAHSAPHRFINLLYSIGFCGVKNRKVIEYRGHGVKAADAPPIDVQTHVVIHPCYVDALQLRNIVVTSLDDVELQHEGLLVDLPESFTFANYTARLDELLVQLDNIPLGRPGAARYEDFIGEVIRLCFFRVLNNVEAKVRDISGTTIKDWIAANVAESGFWEMVRSMYSATQIIWECKNYEKLSSDDFHQASYYMGKALGNFCIVCFRGDYQKEHYYDHIRRIHDGPMNGMVLLLGDADLRVFLRQARNGKVKEAHIQDRFDYTARLIS